jgi:hypothetical protein
LISRPTTKKKTAIRPSFTQPRGERACPATEKGSGVLHSASHVRLVPPRLERVREIAVARSSATLPRPRSWWVRVRAGVGVGVGVRVGVRVRVRAGVGLRVGVRVRRRGVAPGAR